MVVTVGLTVMEEPLPAEGPPQEPENHCQDAPVPNVPPEIDKVDGELAQTEVGLDEAELAGSE